MNLGRPPGRKLDEPLGRSLGGPQGSGGVPCVPPTQQIDPDVYSFLVGFLLADGTFGGEFGIAISGGDDPAEGAVGTFVDAVPMSDFWTDFAFWVVDGVMEIRMRPAVEPSAGIIGIFGTYLDPCGNTIAGEITLIRDEVDTGLFHATTTPPAGWVDGATFYVHCFYEEA